VAGGVRPNVVAPESRAVVDVRTATREDAAHVDAAIRGLRPELAGASLEIRQLSDKPPLEPTPGNRRLWTRAAALAGSLGIPLDEGAAGGSSDGNTASLYAPTLDGLGGVGDGAHAPGEYVCLDRMPERAALLALLLLSPPLAFGD
jgi:glutamate carboxypeptidase